MRIEDRFNNLKLDKTEQNQKAEKKKAAQNGSASSAAEKDTISISSQARTASTLTKQLKDSPEVRTELVNEIREKIESGNYNVSGRQVAEKVVNAAIDDIF
ncbi:flagellar biosynthesis anti-sigma factor FlgM [Limisalsivibrio acetivorans]|uniref:flagellar biosynthesis anti-sigma factor FlgM n=1 Tax=Limisalsivibrio acetivorans TaxID=1304888 RepID=UPI0003B3881E|nr:flagellar biosynthesis anti-sigma factor FlgM [Limisalsivibrio acetivorans]